MRNFEKVETWSFMLSPTIYVELNFYGAIPTADDLRVLDQYLDIADRALSDKDASIPPEAEAARDPFSHSPGQD